MGTEVSQTSISPDGESLHVRIAWRLPNLRVGVKQQSGAERDGQPDTAATRGQRCPPFSQDITPEALPTEALVRSQVAKVRTRPPRGRQHSRLALPVRSCTTTEDVDAQVSRRVERLTA